MVPFSRNFLFLSKCPTLTLCCNLQSRHDSFQSAIFQELVLLIILVFGS